MEITRIKEKNSLHTFKDGTHRSYLEERKRIVEWAFLRVF